MVGCDNPNCPLQWLHLKCLKLLKYTVQNVKRIKIVYTKEALSGTVVLESY